ncbi:hypothetical protein J4457_00050 [Candidatus Woesearchaeota archaeon]|nr:hypothetical protein [Candidatus Woesearchaeota archaeon]
MSIKTITVTEEAYEVIKGMKQEEESFSELFKRIGKQPARIKDIFGAMKQESKEAEALKKRIKSMKEESRKDMGERMNEIRSRLKRNN